MAEERDAGIRCCGLGARERDGEDRVGAEATLVRRSVQLDQPAVERLLVAGVHPAHGVRDLAVHVRDRLRDRLAAVGVAAVAELDRLVHAG